MDSDGKEVAGDLSGLRERGLTELSSDPQGINTSYLNKFESFRELRVISDMWSSLGKVVVVYHSRTWQVRA